MEDTSTENRDEIDKSRNAKFLESLWTYAFLSWLMATFPAMIVLPKLYGGGTTDEATTRNMLIMLVGFCSIYGAIGGLVIGILMGIAGRKDRVLPMFFAPLFGGIWGIVIGAIGGFPIFFIGGIILGWIFAVPFGVVGFTLFSIIYESLAARRPLRWWQILLIEIGVLSLLMSISYYL